MSRSPPQSRFWRDSERSKLTYAQAASMADLPDALRAASYVYVRRGQVAPPLTPQYQGPYVVLERGPKVFKIDLGDREDVVSVDQLKPHRGTAEVLPVRAPRRGRPPLASSLVPDLPPPESALGGGYCGGYVWRVATRLNIVVVLYYLEKSGKVDIRKYTSLFPNSVLY